MAKKANRSAQRNRARPARRPQQTIGATTAPAEGDVVAEQPAMARVAPAAAAQSARMAPASTTRRGPSRRSPAVAAFDYEFLKRDVRTLLVLASAMIVLLIIAYFVFH